MTKQQPCCQIFNLVVLGFDCLRESVAAPIQFRRWIDAVFDMPLMPMPQPPRVDEPPCVFNLEAIWAEPSPSSSAQSRRAWLMEQQDQDVSEHLR